MPPDAPADLIDLLDDLAITQRVEGDSFPGVAIVDLPDQDSIVLSHRHTVAEVLPRVDAVAWVSDPDKYHDRALHDDYIAAMRDHQGQLFFVLNKADLVDERRRSDLELDFMVQLQRDGIASPRVFVTSAAPTIGEPIGVDAVAKHIRDRLGAKRVLTGKILSDVRHALRLVAQRARVDRGTDLDFDARWEEARRVTVAALTDRPDEAAVYDTLCRLEDFVAMMSVESGGTFGRRVVDAFPPAPTGARVERRPGSNRRRSGSKRPEEAAGPKEGRRRCGSRDSGRRDRGTFGTTASRHVLGMGPLRRNGGLGVGRYCSGPGEAPPLRKTPGRGRSFSTLAPWHRPSSSKPR